MGTLSFHYCDLLKFLIIRLCGGCSGIFLILTDSVRAYLESAMSLPPQSQRCVFRAFQIEIYHSCPLIFLVPSVSVDNYDTWIILFQYSDKISKKIDPNFLNTVRMHFQAVKWNYHNDPKFSDRYAWANSADPDQTAPRGAVWSGSTLFAIPSASSGLITLW